LLHDSPSFSSNSILLPKVTLIRGIWWSRNSFDWFFIQYKPANNISEVKQLSTYVVRSSTIHFFGNANTTIDYFPQPILTNSINLRWADGKIEYISDLSKISGFNGNYWVVYGDYTNPLEIEIYGCEDYDLEKGESQSNYNAL
jgi:hypothetical protein